MQYTPPPRCWLCPAWRRERHPALPRAGAGASGGGDPGDSPPARPAGAAFGLQVPGRRSRPTPGEDQVGMNESFLVNRRPRNPVGNDASQHISHVQMPSRFSVPRVCFKLIASLLHTHTKQSYNAKLR